MRTFLTLLLASVIVAGPTMAQTAPMVPVAPPPAVHVAAPVMPVTVPDAASGAGYTVPTSAYRLGAGDKIKVSVYGEADLGGVFTVTGEGKVSVPLIGNVQAAGLSTPDLQASLENSYRQGYLKDPKVNVEVMNFRPFYILGEVKLPGEYPYDNGMTVVKAVALAQGFTYRADQKRVFIKHLNDARETQVPLTSSQTVEPGDTVRIAERYF